MPVAQTVEAAVSSYRELFERQLGRARARLQEEREARERSAVEATQAKAKLQACEAELERLRRAGGTKKSARNRRRHAAADAARRAVGLGRGREAGALDGALRIPGRGAFAHQPAGDA